jgi:hypothetical protein
MAYLDYDSKDAVTLVERAGTMAKEVQEVRNRICLRMDMLYNGVPPKITRSPRRFNHFMPKPFQTVENLVPRYIRALHGTRPYLPIEAKNKEQFGYLADLQSEIYDHYLDKAGFLPKRVLQNKITVVQGIGYMSAEPYLEDVEEPWFDPQSGMVFTKKVKRLRAKLRVWAPWEILAHPRAIGLEEKGMCKFAIKLRLVSRREIKQMYEENKAAFPNCDEEKLYRRGTGASQEKADHWGLQMLRYVGLPVPETDEDDDIYISYESEDRYIDILGGDVLMRDTTSNPMPHGLINLSREIHTVKPHTQDQFCGYGALKPAEELFYLRNDQLNCALDAAAAQTQFRIYYDHKQQADRFTTLPNAMIQIERESGSRITDHFFESKGGALDPDFYRQPEYTDRETDRTTGVNDTMTGDMPDRQTTATRDMIRKEAGSVRLEMGVIESEVFLNDFTHKFIEVMGASMTIADAVEILGPQKAMQMYLPTEAGPELAVQPKRIPGGTNFNFKGRDKLGEEAIKQEMVRATAETIMGFPTTRPDEYQRIFMDREGYTKDEIDRTVMPREEMIMEQMRARALEQRQGQVA